MICTWCPSCQKFMWRLFPLELSAQEQRIDEDLYFMYGMFYETSNACILITICLTGLGYLTCLNMAHQIETELQSSCYDTVVGTFPARQRRTPPMTTTHIQNLTIGWSNLWFGVYLKFPMPSARKFCRLAGILSTHLISLRNLSSIPILECASWLA